MTTATVNGPAARRSGRRVRRIIGPRSSSRSLATAVACGDDSSKASTAVAANGASGNGAGSTTAGATATFVGKVAGTDAYVGVQNTADGVLFYFCDGVKIWRAPFAPAGDSVDTTAPGGLKITAKRGEHRVDRYGRARDIGKHDFHGVPAASGRPACLRLASAREPPRRSVDGSASADGTAHGKQTVTTAQTADSGDHPNPHPALREVATAAPFPRRPHPIRAAAS